AVGTEVRTTSVELSRVVLEQSDLLVVRWVNHEKIRIDERRAPDAVGGPEELLGLIARRRAARVDRHVPAGQQALHLVAASGPAKELALLLKRHIQRQLSVRSRCRRSVGRR